MVDSQLNCSRKAAWRQLNSIAKGTIGAFRAGLSHDDLTLWYLDRGITPFLLVYIS